MKNLTKLFTLLMLTAFTATATQAQDASLNDILKNYFEAIGGEDEWRKIESMTIEGKSTAQGMTAPISLKTMAPAYFKMEMDIGGKKFIQAYDGETAWMFNPFMGGTDAQKMDAEQSKEFGKQKFQDEFLDYEKKGHKVELVGTEEVDGADTYKIKMTKKSGDVVFYFFDTENYVPIMMRALMDSGPAKGQAVETYMSDYQEVDGLMVAHSTEQKVGGNAVFSMTAETIKFNVEGMDAKMFEFPTKEEEKK